MNDEAGSGPAAATVDDPHALVLPWVLSATFAALVLALFVLLPVVHRFQLLRADLLSTSGLPEAFFTAGVVREIERRYEFARWAAAQRGSDTTDGDPEKPWDYECCVCMAQMTQDSASFLAGCGHIFHTECIATWLDNGGHRTCPLCRAPSQTPEDLIPVLSYGVGKPVTRMVTRQ